MLFFFYFVVPLSKKQQDENVLLLLAEIKKKCFGGGGVKLTIFRAWKYVMISNTSNLFACLISNYILSFTKCYNSFRMCTSRWLLGTDDLASRGGYVFFQNNILIPNVAEKNILILVEEFFFYLIQSFCHIT